MYENLRAERARAGLTLCEVAGMTGVAASTMSRYESGRRPVPADVLVKLTGIYGCSADYLLGRTEARRPV